MIKIKCSKCSQEHLGSDEKKMWFPNHSVVQLIGNVIPKSKYFCKTHQHDQAYYCFDDQTLVCIYCAYHGEHSGHECVPIEEAKKRKENALQEVKLQASSKVSELERGLLLLKDEQQWVKSQKESVSQLVEECFRNIEVALQRQKEQLLQELSAHTADISGVLETHIKYAALCMKYAGYIILCVGLILTTSYLFLILSFYGICHIVDLFCMYGRFMV